MKSVWRVLTGTIGIVLAIGVNGYYASAGYRPAMPFLLVIPVAAICIAFQRGQVSALSAIPTRVDLIAAAVRRRRSRPSVKSPCLFLLAASALTACATAHFNQVAFAGEGSAASAKPPTGQTVHVVSNSQMADTVLEARIRAALEIFLLQRGYVLAAPEEAEVYVLATFGSGKRLAASEVSIFKEAEATIVRDRQGNPVRRQYTPGRMESLRVPTYENSVWLQVLSSDARYFRATGMVRNFWRGEAAMKGKPESLSHAAPYLLVPSLKFFGRGTRTVVTMDVREKDLSWH